MVVVEHWYKKGIEYVAMLFRLERCGFVPAFSLHPTAHGAR